MTNILKSYKRCVVLAVATFVVVGTSMSFGEETIEEVVVTAKSIKASQLAAIDAKRMADNRKTVFRDRSRSSRGFLPCHAR